MSVVESGHVCHVAYVVNDDPVQLRMIAALLQQEGLAVRSYQNASQALTSLVEQGPPALIVTDLYMPGIDGWRFCRLLRSPEYPAFNSVPIMVISATFAGERPRELTSELGANAFISVPFAPDDFRACTRELLCGKTLTSPIRVLIVDDSRTTLHMLRAAFEAHGYVVDCAENGVDALRFFRRKGHEMIVVDYHLPDMLGDGILEQVKAMSPGCVAVMITTDPTPELALRFLNMGADGYIRKPFEPDYLVAVCERGRKEKALLRIKDRIEERTRELQLSEDRYRKLFTEMLDGFALHEIICDDDGVPCSYRFLDVNPAFAAMLGRTRDELIGKTILEVSPGIDSEWIRVYGEVALSGLARHFERYEQDFGKYFEVVAYCPKLGQFAVIARDRTERQRFEQELRLSEEKFAKAFRASPDIVSISTREEGRYVDVNDAFQGLLGYSREEVIGKTSAELGLWMDCRERDRLKGRYYATGSISNEEVQQRTKSGEVRTFLLSVDTIEVEGEPCFLAVYRDITDKKLAEAQRNQLETQIQQAQKLESLGILAGGIAHDFNNILMGILGYAELARLDLPSLSPAQESLGHIETAAHRAADLARQMLAYSGRGKFVIQRVDVAEVVREMAHLLQVSISKKCTLEYHFADNIPAIAVDVTQFRQVIMNLILNASDAIGDETGLITLTSALIACDGAYLASSYLDESLAEGPYVSIEVTDTGCGMSQDVLSRIFDPFFTTKFAGRGLGLAAVLGIVRGHHGAIQVQSVPDRGTTFRILFPAAPASASLGDVQSPRLRRYQGTGTVLIADDEDTVRNLAKLFLEKAGFDVLLAADGHEAVDVFKRHSDNIRVILLDMCMPKMNGDEVFREVRRIRHDARVVLTSGYNELDTTNRVAAKELAGFLQKPYRMDELLDAVHHALEGQTYVSGEIAENLSF